MNINQDLKEIKNREKDELFIKIQNKRKDFLSNMSKSNEDELISNFQEMCCYMDFLTTKTLLIEKHLDYISRALLIMAEETVNKNHPNKEVNFDDYK